jgi:hypothetical protein
MEKGSDDEKVKKADTLQLQYIQTRRYCTRTISSSASLMLLRRSLRMLMKGVAPIPRPTYLLVLWSTAPRSPKAARLGTHGVK